MHIDGFKILLVLIIYNVNSTSSEQNLETETDTENTLLSSTDIIYEAENVIKLLVLDTAADQRTAKRLEKIGYILRTNCTFPKANQFPNQVSCPPTADFLTCFPATRANDTFVSTCPIAHNVSDTAFLSRLCHSDGTWDSTDYSICHQSLVITTHPLGCRWGLRNSTNQTQEKYLDCDKSTGSEDNDDDELSFHKFIVFANLFGFSITIIPVTGALFIFLTIRSLRCTRNMIHCNMLLTFVFKCTAHIGLYIFVMTGGLYDKNNVFCIIFSITIFYSVLCSFFWMMIEAVYLITVIVAAYSSNKIKLWWYLVIGWVLPLIPLTPYVLMTHLDNNTTCSWLASSYDSPHENLIEIPIKILLAINSVLLIIILYVIIKKLKTHNDAVKTKYNQYKKINPSDSSPISVVWSYIWRFLLAPL